MFICLKKHPYNCFPLACCHCNLMKNEMHDPSDCFFCFADKEDGLRHVIEKNIEEEKIRVSLLK